MSKYKPKSDDMINSISLEDGDENLKLIDVTCPICLSILIKPVTMPCHHSLCMTCFELNVSEANLACPLCRKRISIWVRRMTKTKKLMDEKLWQKIQARFKNAIDARMNGYEDENNSFTTTFPPRKVSAPGEIREEFETQLKNLREEEETNRQREEASSKMAILALQEKETKQLNNLIHEREAICEQDFEFAKEVRTSQMKETLDNLKRKKNPKSPHIHQKKSNCSTSSSPPRGPLDFFIEQVTPESRNTVIPQITPPESRDKTNSSPKHFKRDETKAVPKFKWRSMQRAFSAEIRVPSADSLSVYTSYPSSPLSTSSSNSSSRVFKDITCQYSSESEAEFDSEENIPKLDKPKMKKILKIKKDGRENGIYEERDDARPAKKHSETRENEGKQFVNGPGTSADSDSQWTFLSEEVDENNPAYKEKFLKLLEEQKAFEERLRQEKEDRRFALQLQKSFREVDRTKGSEDEYCLRKQDVKSYKKPKRIFPDESPPSTSNHLLDNPKKKNLRQTTLVESLAKKHRRL